MAEPSEEEVVHDQSAARARSRLASSCRHGEAAELAGACGKEDAAGRSLIVVTPLRAARVAMPVPKSKLCVNRRRIVAGLCWKPHDSRVREDRPGAPASRRAEPAELFARARGAAPVPRRAGAPSRPSCLHARSTSAPPARGPGMCGRLNPGRGPVPPCRSTVNCSLKGALGAGRRGAVPWVRRCRQLGSCGGSRRGNPQIAIRLRDLHRVGDVRTGAAIGPERNPDAAPENRGRRGGDDSVGLRARPRRFHARGEAAVAGPGGAGFATWSVHPATTACEGEEKQVVAGRGRLVTGRGRGSRRPEACTSGPGRTRRRLVNRGEGREPIVVP